MARFRDPAGRPSGGRVVPSNVVDGPRQLPDGLFGNIGSDELFGNAGDDIITDGGGFHSVRLCKGDGTDRIEDFRSGYDQLDLQDFRIASFDDLLDLADDRAFGLKINLGAGNILRFTNVTKAELAAEDVILWVARRARLAPAAARLLRLALGSDPPHTCGADRPRELHCAAGAAGCYASPMVRRRDRPARYCPTRRPWVAERVRQHQCPRHALTSTLARAHKASPSRS